MALLRGLLIVTAAVAILASAAALVVELRSGKTDRIRDAGGNPLPGSIAFLEPVELGGLEQWILARGENGDNPLLLWLHGGPGAAQMPVARPFNGSLEKEFVVVHWDQRGAGKSNPPGFDESTMTVGRFTADTVELTEYLKERFDRERIYLLGHSWGAQLGILVARDHPEHYYAYIGVSQLTDPMLSQELAYSWLREEIERSGNEKDLLRLEKLGSPRYVEHADYVAFAGLVDRYGGNMDLGFSRMALAALRSPEYRLRDYYAWVQGSMRGSGPMWEESQAFNLYEEVRRLEIPVYFFSGAKDRNTPPELIGDYLEFLDAPAGSELVIFEESAHTPFLAEPDRFHRELVRAKRETLPR